MAVDLMKMLGRLGERVTRDRKIGLDLSGVPTKVPATYKDIKLRNGNTISDTEDGDLCLNGTIITQVPTLPRVVGKHNLKITGVDFTPSWELDTDASMPTIPVVNGTYGLNINTLVPTWAIIDYSGKADKVVPVGGAKLAKLNATTGNLEATTIDPATVVTDVSTKADKLVAGTAELARVNATTGAYERSGIEALAAATPSVPNVLLANGGSTAGTWESLSDYVSATRLASKFCAGLLKASTNMFTATAFTSAPLTSTLNNPSATLSTYPGAEVAITVVANAAWDYVTSLVVNCLDCDGHPFRVEMVGAFTGAAGSRTIAAKKLQDGTTPVGVSRIVSVTAVVSQGNVPAVNFSATTSAETLKAAYASYLTTVPSTGFIIGPHTITSITTTHAATGMQTVVLSAGDLTSDNYFATHFVAVPRADANILYTYTT